ncbi:Phosphoserine phosphatase RsbU [Methylococcales bacterium]|nr:Phosphoserine phosphatase RsbU [Methylococcales bacterium]
MSITQPSEEDTEHTRVITSHTAPVAKTSAGDMAHYIVVVGGAERGKKIEIGLAPIRLGRGADSDFRLSDAFVSTHHCTVGFEEGQIWVTDTGSTNGSFIEGERVRGRVVWPISTSVQIGEQILRHEYRRRVDMQDADDLAKDLRHAANYVQTLLPAPLPTGPVLTAWQFQPSTELGGDIFDYFWLDADRFVFYLLDVCGHGVGAALHSVSVFNLLRQKSLAGVDPASPAQVMKALNEAFPMERYGSMYFTLWYGIYHLRQQSLTFASAGHPPGLLFVEADRRLFGLSTDNPPIGVEVNVQFAENTTALHSGFRLYLFSDGVYEFRAKDGDCWGWAEFARYLGTRLGNGKGQPDAIFHDLRAKTESNRFDDDFSLLMLDFPR